MRLSRSRPNSSVPNGLVADGGRSRCPMFCTSGFFGAISGALIAESNSTATTSRPNIRGKRRRIERSSPPGRRPVRAASSAAGAVTSAWVAVGVVAILPPSLPETDTRIEHWVEQIDQQVDDDEGGSDQEDDPRRHLVVSIQDRRQDEPTHPWQSE